MALYARQGRFVATEGNRDRLAEILSAGTGAMPGCRLYLVMTDPKDANAVLVTEVWDSEADHAASLALPEVRAAIAKARPIIAGMDGGALTVVAAPGLA
ncbi:MAG: putative quinol monooxygenase [Devosia sp.]